MFMKKNIKVKGTDILLLIGKKEDYISLTDIAKYKDVNRSDDVVKNWMRNKN